MPHFVIMGAGRVGVMLARTLEASGHTVAVIDQDERAFQPLRKGFEGRLVTGVGFDEDTLKRAGITEAYAFAAVSSGDNSNIIAARVAREMFKVKNVVARVYDPNRAEFFQRMGIPTVARCVGPPTRCCAVCCPSRRSRVIFVNPRAASCSPRFHSMTVGRVMP